MGRCPLILMLDADGFAATLIVTRLLDAMDVPYVIGGSVASTVHGLIRTTVDVDLVADLRPDNVAPLIAALSDQFYVDEPTVREAIARRSSFNLIHLQSMVKVDVFLPGNRAFDRQQLARRIAQPVGPDPDETLWILTAEDVILAKLDWFRQGGEVSERQWRDVLGVVKLQGERLDLAYLRRWATALNVADLLEKALEDPA
jgi:hypothetical protein